jgi:plastocyanin
MKNTQIIIIVLVLVALALFFGFKGKTLEAPEKNANVEVNSPVTNNMPAPGFEGTDVEEMVVEKGGEVKEFAVNGTNFAFDPKTITVKKGDKVKITFNSTQGFHDFVVDEYGLATKQMQSPGTEVLEFVANKPGSFEYYCSVGSHRQMGMVGTLKVE